MIIPAIYSIVVLNIHTRKYDKIISNVSSANDINLIAKEEIPSELWNIVCGRKEFSEGRQYHLLATISTGINEMKNNILDSTSQEKLEVASRTCITLSKNIQKLEELMKNGSSVKENEVFLDDIRTITILFSEIMQDFIMTEKQKLFAETYLANGFNAMDAYRSVFGGEGKTPSYPYKLLKNKTIADYI